MDTLTQQRLGVSFAGTAAGPHESPVSAVSWPAIFAGAIVAAAASLVLVALGSGFGLASVSPWHSSGASATTFTVMTAIWFIVVQWVASGLGGYLSGRLRTKWANTHTHEVFFRDTAHGFITWAVGTIIVAVALSAAVTSAVGGGVRAAATVAQATAADIAPYNIDTLFRSPRADASANSAEARAEAMRILANAIASSDFPTTDRTYLAELIVARTGVSAEDAQKRVDNAIVQTRQAADTARKAASMTSIFTALSMLVGAFIACIAAALGGQRRDLHA